MNKNTYDYPVYLFNEGTNYETYRLLGAASVQKNSKKMWRFRVWAPNAQSVSVVGDFNNWDRNIDVMTMIDGSGIWECYVKNVKRYDVYKYSIEGIDQVIRLKADPYAYHCETAPADGSKIYDIGDYVWNDAKYLEKRKKANPYDSPMNIYEVHLGSWKQYSDGNKYSYKALEDTLIPYVKQMGYTHIELMPITEYPFDGSWGYQMTGLFAPTSRHGTPHDFMSFVDKCHSEGIGVIMDFVLSHFPKDSFGLYEFDGTCLYEYSDIYKREHKSWGTRVFDYNKPQVRSFLISAVDFWLTKYHIDGMRLDAVASMLYLNYDRSVGEWRPNEQGGEYNLEAIYFLQTLNKAILTRHSDALMIAEESTAFPMVTMPPKIGGLGFNYKWNMGWMNDTLDYIKIDPFFRKGAHDKLTFSITYAFSENYVLPFSHDEVVHGKASLIGKVPGSYEQKFGGLKALLGYQMAHPGKKLNFMGNEFGQFIEWNHAKELDWFLLDYPMHKNLHNFVRDLNHFYLENKPLYEQDTSFDGFRWIVVDDKTQNMIVFERFDRAGGSIIAAINFSAQDREGYRIGVSTEGVYADVLNSESEKYGGKAIANKKMETAKEPMHGQEQSIAFDIKGNSIMFIRKEKDLQKSSSGSKTKKISAKENKKEGE